MKEQLTREQILAMQPGRELDALVAEMVMGFKSIRFGRNDPSAVWIEDECRRKFQPSTDISAAWEVWKKVQKDHIHMSIHWMDSSYMAEIIETDSDDGYRYLGQVEAPSETEAIVKCALIAVLEVRKGNAYTDICECCGKVCGYVEVEE